MQLKTVDGFTDQVRIYFLMPTLNNYSEFRQERMDSPADEFLDVYQGSDSLPFAGVSYEAEG